MIVFHQDNYKDFTELYQDILHSLFDPSEEIPTYQIAPRGLPITEIVNATVIVDPKACTIDFTRTEAPERQEAYDRYRKAELEWYLSGNTLASSAPSKFWNQLAGLDGHITSNYGHMMLFDKIYPPYPLMDDAPPSDPHWQTAFERVIETLFKDPDSRQAIAHYNQPRHCYPQNKDFPCTVYSQFFLRNGKLNMTTYQRSCDVIKGFSYDVPWSCHFMEMVCEELKKKGAQVELGEFTHVFGSLHLYKKDEELAVKIGWDAR
jgi:thymidylate synthase